MSIDPRLQENYDAYYGDAELARWRTLGAIDKVDNISALCAGVPHATVLEVGAGEGSVLQGLADRKFGEKHFALDISASGVERIRARQMPTLAECQVFDGYRIPYADRSFDLAVLSHVVEHVEHPRLLINEAARVASHLYIEVPLEHNRRLPKDFVWDSVGHINYYTAQTIRLLVQSCGHEVLQQKQTHPAKAQYRYRLGARGVVSYLVKDIALRVMPSVAQGLWTYHSSLLVRSGVSP